MNFYGDISYYDNKLNIYPKTFNIWNNYNNDNKEALLSKLSQELDEQYKWAGKREHFNQGLEFPRNFSAYWIYENLKDIYFYNNKKIPNELLSCMIRLIDMELSPDNLNTLYKKGVKSFNDSLMSVSLDKPTDGDTKTMKFYVNKYLFWFTILGYTEYRRKYGVL